MSELEDIWHDQDTPRDIASMKREIERLRAALQRRLPRLTERERLFIKTLNPTVLGQELVDTIQRVTGVKP